VCLESTGGPTYNLLLEYADCDLDEYFADTHPPEDAQQILHLWKQFGGLAEALQTVHSGSTKKYLGRAKSGYVHDIKPDNILVFRHQTEGIQLKLADFGFSKFVDVQDGEPHREIMEGCTRTWGKLNTFMFCRKTNTWDH
jgi:serine/threonine protein kinase